MQNIRFYDILYIVLVVGDHDQPVVLGGEGRGGGGSARAGARHCGHCLQVRITISSGTQTTVSSKHYLFVLQWDVVCSGGRGPAGADDQPGRGGQPRQDGGEDQGGNQGATPGKKCSQAINQ